MAGWSRSSWDTLAGHWALRGAGEKLNRSFLRSLGLWHGNQDGIRPPVRLLARSSAYAKRPKSHLFACWSSPICWDVNWSANVAECTGHAWPDACTSPLVASPAAAWCKRASCIFCASTCGGAADRTWLSATSKCKHRAMWTPLGRLLEQATTIARLRSDMNVHARSRARAMSTEHTVHGRTHLAECHHNSEAIQSALCSLYTNIRRRRREL